MRPTHYGSTVLHILQNDYCNLCGSGSSTYFETQKRNLLRTLSRKLTHRRNVDYVRSLSSLYKACRYGTRADKLKEKLCVPHFLLAHNCFSLSACQLRIWVALLPSQGYFKQREKETTNCPHAELEFNTLKSLLQKRCFYFAPAHPLDFTAQVRFKMNIKTKPFPPKGKPFKMMENKVLKSRRVPRGLRFILILIP